MNIALLSTDADRWGLGIRLLSTVLKESGHSTKLIFLSSEDASYSQGVLEATKELLSGVDLVGIGCLSRGASRAIQLLRTIRPLRKFTVWGGLHATLNPESCAKEADIICRGEGEDLILELIRNLENGHAFSAGRPGSRSWRAPGCRWFDEPMGRNMSGSIRFEACGG